MRPCPWVSCKHHLYLDVNPETGSIKINFPDLESWELAETCALDVAERGGITLEEVGEIMNLTRERIRQVEVRGLLKLKMAVAVAATSSAPSCSRRRTLRSTAGRRTSRRARDDRAERGRRPVAQRRSGHMVRSRALVSVSDKRGVVELARGSASHGVEILSTGGTAARAARRRRSRSRRSPRYTGAPEILDGRVKTLHPKIHGGLLGRGDARAPGGDGRRTASSRSISSS